MVAKRAKRATRNKKAESRLDRIHRGWAERHPERASTERALRIRHRDEISQFDHANYAGTPETHAHARRTPQGSLARLFMAGELNNDQLAWGAAIAATYERICRGIGVRTVSLETRIDSSGEFGGTFFEALGQVRSEVAYSKWRAALPLPEPVLAMIVDDVGVSVAARRYGMANRRAKALLIDALDLWGEMIGVACDEVDKAAVYASHAKVL